MKPFHWRAGLAAIAALLLWSVLFAPPASAAEAKNQLIIVNKQTNELAFFENGALVKTFPVGTGRTPDLTPEGTFPIVNKIKNRPYYKDHIPGGDPRNPLGDRWLGLEVDGTYGTTYAIHGNNNPKSIGRYVSAGCIRMNNDAIHWLFPQIELGTKVVITSSGHSFAAIAAAHGYPVWQRYEGKLSLNGQARTLSRDVVVADSRVFLPMRELFELLGASVAWDGETKTVTAIVGGRTITHVPQTGTVTVDGRTIAITPSLVSSNTVLLPVRGIFELIGYDIAWDGRAKEIRMTSVSGAF
ncbi:L,D-transpeptidase family protein [Paenibacillus sp. GCM10023250]|uniref:L,D-transpeptidase family protein n=1 Tax=Paenibacillus sp. GCM10023250 TaxID=3252648 RepID=UPI0036165B86